jgi:hypothetical protein
VYLDADIVLSTDGLRRIVSTLRDPAPIAGKADPLAVVPRRELDLAGSPMLVRAYYAINARLPVYRDALFGRGVIALAEAGRARFGEFPDLMADDLFLDSLFTTAEKRQVDAAVTRVAVPRKTRDLIHRLVRVRAGNTAMRAAAGRTDRPTDIKSSARLSWLRDVVAPRPWLAPAAVCYVAMTVTAAILARRSGRAGTWGRDESSRQDVDATPPR